MKKWLFCLLLPIAAAASVQAAVSELYVAEVPIAGQGAGERRRALPKALEQVLIKLSGIRNFDQYPQVNSSLKNASSILVSFHYTTVETVLPDGSEAEEMKLVVQFSADRVDELMRALQLPRWKTERPPAELWVVVDNGLDRRIMPVELAYAWESMEDVAQMRGLPMVWPVPDEEGQFPADLQLLWGGYTEDLGNPRDRGALIAAARREGPAWSVRLNLEYDGGNWAWRVQDLELQNALAEGMHQAVDRIAAANTIAATDIGSWLHELTVRGVRNSQDYERGLAYLQGISLVEHVSVVAARQGSVTFRLELNALPRYLEEVVNSGQVLEFDEIEGNYALLP